MEKAAHGGSSISKGGGTFSLNRGGLFLMAEPGAGAAATAASTGGAVVFFIADELSCYEENHSQQSAPDEEGGEVLGEKEEHGARPFCMGLVLGGGGAGGCHGLLRQLHGALAAEEVEKPRQK